MSERRHKQLITKQLKQKNRFKCICFRRRSHCKKVNEWPDYEDFAVKIMVDELEINQIKEKQTADVYVQAVNNKVYKGKVVDINEKGIINGSVTSYAVTIDLEDETKVKENMSVSADVLVALEKDFNNSNRSC